MSENTSPKVPNIRTVNLRFITTLLVLVVSQLLALVTLPTSPLSYLWYVLTILLTVAAYARGRLFGLVASLVPIFALGTNDILRLFVVRDLNSLPTIDIIWFWVFPMSGFIAGDLGDRIRSVAAQSDLLQANQREDLAIDRHTGLMNRAMLLEELRREVSRAQRRFWQRTGTTAADSQWGQTPASDLRESEQVSLLVIAIRHYSDIQALYGAEQQDAVLRSAIAAIERVRRQTDTIAYTGPGEFTLILPETSAAGATTARLRLPASIGPLPVTVRSGEERQITIELIYGISTTPEDGESEMALLELAERRRSYGTS